MTEQQFVAKDNPDKIQNKHLFWDLKKRTPESFSMVKNQTKRNQNEDFHPQRIQRFWRSKRASAIFIAKLHEANGRLRLQSPSSGKEQRN